MEDSHHVLSPTLSTISDPLQRTPLIDRGLSLRILHIPPPLLAGHLLLIRCLFTRTLWLIHILNLDLCLTFQAFQLGQPSRYLCGPNNAPAWSMTRNQRRNTRLKPYLPLLHQHPVDRKTRVTYRWMMTLTTPTRGNLIELLQSVLGTRSEKATTASAPPASIVTTSTLPTTPTVTLTPNPNETVPQPNLNDGRRGSMSIHSPGAVPFLKRYYLEHGLNQTIVNLRP